MPNVCENLADPQVITQKIIELFSNDSIDDNVKRKKATLLASRIPSDALGFLNDNSLLSNDEKLTQLKILFTTHTESAIEKNTNKHLSNSKKTKQWSVFGCAYMASIIVVATSATAVGGTVSAGVFAAAVGVATVGCITYGYYRNKSLVAENNNLEAQINFMNNDNANELLQEETGKMVLMKKDFANFKEWVSSFFSRREIPSSDASHPVVGRVVGRRIETQGFLAV